MKAKTILITIILLLLPLCVVLSGVGCKKSNIDYDADPAKAILGKWKIIENTFGPVNYPEAYSEYRPDSVLIHYNSKDDIIYSKYWFSDSLLYEGNLPFIFEFLTNDKLRLDNQTPAIVTVVILKRIK